MTDDERFSLIVSLMGPVPSIGVPALQSSDASMGDTNPGYRPDDKGAAAFPASIVVGSSFDLSHARDGGAAIGREARLRGFNVMLAGGINLARDVRNGRNFEYWPKRRWLPACLGKWSEKPLFCVAASTTISEACCDMKVEFKGNEHDRQLKPLSIC